MATHDFTTIRTAGLLDFIVEAVDNARDAASVSPSWLRAIDSAYDYLLTTDAISYDLDHHAIRVESATEPGKFYTANGDCECRAFTHGKGICWHRACARIIRRALDLQEEARQLAADLADEQADRDAEAAVEVEEREPGWVVFSNGDVEISFEDQQHAVLSHPDGVFDLPPAVLRDLLLSVERIVSHPQFRAVMLAV